MKSIPPRRDKRVQEGGDYGRESLHTAHPLSSDAGEGPPTATSLASTLPSSGSGEKSRKSKTNLNTALSVKEKICMPVLPCWKGEPYSKPLIQYARPLPLRQRRPPPLHRLPKRMNPILTPKDVSITSPESTRHGISARSNFVGRNQAVRHPTPRPQTPKLKHSLALASRGSPCQQKSSAGVQGGADCSDGGSVSRSVRTLQLCSSSSESSPSPPTSPSYSGHSYRRSSPAYRTRRYRNQLQWYQTLRSERKMRHHKRKLDELCLKGASYSPGTSFVKGSSVCQDEQTAELGLKFHGIKRKRSPQSGQGLSPTNRLARKMDRRSWRRQLDSSSSDSPLSECSANTTPIRAHSFTSCTSATPTWTTAENLISPLCNALTTSHKNTSSHKNNTLKNIHTAVSVTCEATGQNACAEAENPTTSAKATCPAPEPPVTAIKSIVKVLFITTTDKSLNIKNKAKNVTTKTKGSNIKTKVQCPARSSKDPDTNSTSASKMIYAVSGQNSHYHTTTVSKELNNKPGPYKRSNINSTSLAEDAKGQPQSTMCEVVTRNHTHSNCNNLATNRAKLLTINKKKNVPVTVQKPLKMKNSPSSGNPLAVSASRISNLNCRATSTVLSSEPTLLTIPSVRKSYKNIPCSHKHTLTTNQSVKLKIPNESEACPIINCGTMSKVHSVKSASNKSSVQKAALPSEKAVQESLSSSKKRSTAQTICSSKAGTHPEEVQRSSKCSAIIPSGSKTTPIDHHQEASPTPQTEDMFKCKKCDCDKGGLLPSKSVQRNLEHGFLQSFTGPNQKPKMIAMPSREEACTQAQTRPPNPNRPLNPFKYPTPASGTNFKRVTTNPGNKSTMKMQRHFQKPDTPRPKSCPRGKKYSETPLSGRTMPEMGTLESQRTSSATTSFHQDVGSQRSSRGSWSSPDNTVSQTHAMNGQLDHSPVPKVIPLDSSTPAPRPAQKPLVTDRSIGPSSECRHEEGWRCNDKDNRDYIMEGLGTATATNRPSTPSQERCIPDKEQGKMRECRQLKSPPMEDSQERVSSPHSPTASSPELTMAICISMRAVLGLPLLEMDPTSINDSGSSSPDPALQSYSSDPCALCMETSQPSSSQSSALLGSNLNFTPQTPKSTQSSYTCEVSQVCTFQHSEISQPAQPPQEEQSFMQTTESTTMQMVTLPEAKENMTDTESY